MKAIIKLIWFAVAIVLIQKVGGNFLTTNNVNFVSDKLTTFMPGFLKGKINFAKFFVLEQIKQLIFFLVLFLGLDIISGDIKGIIKGPIKLILNGVLYTAGFTLVFFLIDEFALLL